MLGLGLQFCNQFAFPARTAKWHFCLSYFYNNNKGQSQDSIRSKNERQKKWFSVAQDCFFLQKHTKCLFVVCAFAKLKLQTILIWAPSSSEAGTGWRPRRLKSKCKFVGLNGPFFKRGIPSFQHLHLCVLCACMYGAHRRQCCLEIRAGNPREGHAMLVRGLQLCCWGCRQSVGTALA